MLVSSLCLSFPTYNWQSLLHTRPYHIPRANAISFGFPNFSFLSVTCILSCLKLDSKILEQEDYLLIFKTFTTFSEIHIYSFIKNSTSGKCQGSEISHSTLWNANIKASHALCISIFFNEVQLSWILCLYFSKTRKCGVFLKSFLIAHPESVYSRCTKNQTR